MEYQKILNMLDYIRDQPSKFKTKNWIEINDESRGTYKTYNQIRFTMSMLRSTYVIILMHIYLIKEL